MPLLEYHSGTAPGHIFHAVAVSQILVPNSGNFLIKNDPSGVTMQVELQLFAFFMHLLIVLVLLVIIVSLFTLSGNFGTKLKKTNIFSRDRNYLWLFLNSYCRCCYAIAIASYSYRSCCCSCFLFGLTG